MPENNWKYYQEWHNVIFAHWKVDEVVLKKLIPKGLYLDLFSGEAWISLVAFTLKKMRPHYLPAFPAFSDFHEINMRTYVVRHNKPGIYFLSLEAQKTFSALLARLITGLNYYKSDISHGPDFHESENRKRLFYLKTRYNQGIDVSAKTDLDRWLTDRFTLFHELSGDIFSHDIHHRDWPLKTLKIETFEINYRFVDLLISNYADLYHYSDGVQVPTWGKVKA
jgi:uncharacterized protein